MNHSLKHLPPHKREDLEYLTGRVKVLLDITERLCMEKIESYKGNGE